MHWHGPHRALHSLLLVLKDAIQYRKEGLLCNISAKSLAQALFQVFSLVGILKEILTH